VLPLDAKEAIVNAVIAHKIVATGGDLGQLLHGPDTPAINSIQQHTEGSSATMATNKRTTKKTSPAFNGSVIVIIDQEGDNDDELTTAILDLLDGYTGVNDLRVLLDVSEDDEEDDVEDDEEDDVEDDEEDDEEDEDDDEEDEDDEEAVIYDEEELADLDNSDLKELLEYWEIELEGRFSSKKAIAAILEAQDEEYGEDDEDDEEDDEEDDDEGDVEEIDEDALNEMGLAELKSLYSEVVGSDPKKGMRKATIIEAILDTAEED